MRRHLLVLLLFCLFPAVAYADPWLMKVQFALASLPKILFIAVRVWLLIALLLALASAWRVLRGPVKEKHRSRRAAAARLLVWLVWGIAPLILVTLMLNRQWLIDRWPSLPVAMLWIGLSVPGLLVPVRFRRAELVRLTSLAAADFAGSIFLLQQVVGQNRELDWLFLIPFILLLHLIVVFGHLAAGRPHLGTRWLAFLLAAFCGAVFIVPPARSAERTEYNFGAILQVPGIQGPLLGAVIQQEGQTAVFAYADQPKKLFEVNLANGEKRLVYLTDGPRLRQLATDENRDILVAATGGPGDKRFYQYRSFPFTPAGVYSGGAAFAPAALAINNRYLAAGGEGEPANFRVCPRQSGQAANIWEVDRLCRELLLPITRVGSLLLSPQRDLAIVAEGGSGLFDGWRLVNVNLLNGNIIRVVTAGRALGGMVYDPEHFIFFLARPSLGMVEKRIPDSLELLERFAVDPGIDLILLDSRREWLLGANSRDGHFLIFDLLSHSIITRIPIGRGIVSLDYYPRTDTVLIAADRGLIQIKIGELPGLARP